MLLGVRPSISLASLPTASTSPRFHFSVGLLDSHDRGLIDDDAFAFGIGQSIGGAEVNREISGEQAKQRAEFHVSPSG